MNEEGQIEAKLHEIMAIARRLKWFQPNPKGYALMQGSEVEKCILMALDEKELSRLRDAAPKSFIIT